MSGVARFAVRLANGLASRGHAVGLLMHAPTADVAPLSLPTDDRVLTFDCTDLSPIESAGPETFINRYREAAERLTRLGPCTLALGQHAGPFAVATMLPPDAVRAIGVAHSDNGYDTRVLAHYEPMLHAMIGVSDELTDQLARQNTGRASDITGIAYGVEIPASPVQRKRAGGRPLRLLYAGRLEHRQKRVLSLPTLAVELDRRRIEYELTIVGAGPAKADLEAACRDTQSVTLLPAASPSMLAGLLDTHDALVLPSRFEGLSIAMLEALAHGCIPVVAPSRSGTAQAVLPGITGEIANVTPDDSEHAVGLALADAVDALRRRDLAEMRTRCRAHAAEHFGIEQHIDQWASLLERLAHMEPRQWPADRAAVFDDPSASGSVPIDAADRCRRVLEAIGDAPMAVHGAGAHTRALADVLSSADLVCVTDDDRQRYGERMLGTEIVDPARAAERGASHVIISTHLHETDIWRRRAIYESQGLIVHRLYADRDAG